MVVKTSSEREKNNAIIQNITQSLPLTWKEATIAKQAGRSGLLNCETGWRKQPAIGSWSDNCARDDFLASPLEMMLLALFGLLLALIWRQNQGLILHVPLHEA